MWRIMLWIVAGLFLLWLIGGLPFLSRTSDQECSLQVIDGRLYVSSNSGQGYSSANHWSSLTPTGTLATDPELTESITSFCHGTGGWAYLDKAQGLIFRADSGARTVISIPATHYYTVVPYRDGYLITCENGVFRYVPGADAVSVFAQWDVAALGEGGPFPGIGFALAPAHVVNTVILSSRGGYPVLRTLSTGAMTRWDQGLTLPDPSESATAVVVEGGNGEFCTAVDGVVYVAKALGGTWRPIFHSDDAFAPIVRSLVIINDELYFDNNMGLFRVAPLSGDAPTLLMKTPASLIMSRIVPFDGYLYLEMFRLPSSILCYRVPVPARTGTIAGGDIAIVVRSGKIRPAP